MPESSDKTSERLRIQICDDNGAGEILQAIWPGEGLYKDSEISKTKGVIDVDNMNDTHEAVLPLLMELDKQLPDCELTDILSSVAMAVWERAKIEFKGE